MTTMVAATVTAMLSALASGTPVASQIGRVRLRPITKEQALAVVVRPLRAEVSEAELSPGYPIGWTSDIAVECYARCGADTTPDQAVDPLIQAVYARLLADPTLGGVVLVLRPQGIAWDFDADGDQTTCATLVFTARHRTQGATLT